MPEKPNEIAARQVVAHALNVVVERFEDGSAPSQVDALIHLPHGIAALEIVGDHEAAFNAQWDALERVGHQVAVPGLRRVWSAQLARTAKVREVARELPALLMRWQDAWSDA